MNDAQKRVVALLDTATPESEREKWFIGYKSTHYKRLSVSKEKADELALLGWSTFFAYFEVSLYYTQSLIVGMSLCGDYQNIEVVTNSQYGKTFIVSGIGLILADRGEPVYVAGGRGKMTEMIMNKAIMHLQTADAGMISRMMESADKVQKLQAAMRKNKFAFVNKGFMESMSLGTSFSDPIKGNDAVGNGGNVIVDEASLIPDANYAELGRRQFASETGKPYLSLEISNPHNAGRFWDKLTAPEIPSDVGIIWMDCLTAYEEGRIKTKEQIYNSEFFANKSTCIRYLLCELEDYTSESLFGALEKFEDTYAAVGKVTWFAGIDSAYTGVDSIETGLVGVDEEGTIILQDALTIDKINWEDGKTGQEVVRKCAHIIKAFKIPLCCVDKGYGVYLIEGLIPEVQRICHVMGINFGEAPTKERKNARHFSSVYAANMRAELHLDLQDLMDNRRVVCEKELAKKLQPQMNAVRAIRKDNGKTSIISKEEIKNIIGRSPDQLDSILLALHAMILYYMQEGTYFYANNS